MSSILGSGCMRGGLYLVLNDGWSLPGPGYWTLSGSG
jgi:hypothetical protein